MTYRIFETDGFKDDLAQDFGGRREKILLKLRAYVYPQLAVRPRFGGNIRKLREYSPEIWRYRIREYRFFYQVDEQEKIIFMIAAAHRNEAYRQ
jgi:mRNA interferase RelE/StbE